MILSRLTYSAIRIMKAWILAVTRRVEEALEYAEKCIQLDIQHPYTGWIAAEAYRMNRDYDRAIEVFRSMPQMPASVHSQIATCLAGIWGMERNTSMARS